MTTNTRIDLKGPYAEKGQARLQGAQRETENRTWYAPTKTTSDTPARISRDTLMLEAKNFGAIYQPCPPTRSANDSLTLSLGSTEQSRLSLRSIAPGRELLIRPMPSQFGVREWERSAEKRGRAS
jgi:hypothetical protein